MTIHWHYFNNTPEQFGWIINVCVFFQINKPFERKRNATEDVKCYSSRLQSSYFWPLKAFSFFFLSLISPPVFPVCGSSYLLLQLPFANMYCTREQTRTMALIQEYKLHVWPRSLVYSRPWSLLCLFPLLESLLSLLCDYISIKYAISTLSLKLLLSFPLTPRCLFLPFVYMSSCIGNVWTFVCSTMFLP